MGETLDRMAFWDHVEALRGVLVRSGILLVVLTAVFFVLMPYLFDSVILAPCSGNFLLYRLFESMSGRIPGFPDFTADGFHVELINIKLASQFFIHMSTSFWLALVAAFPVILYWLWGFVAPGLYSEERRGVRTAFSLGCVMFYAGVAVGYLLVFPLTLRFLAEYKVSIYIPNQISLESYMDNFVTLILMMGLVFELPLVAWLLGRMGLLTRGFFREYRRHAIVALLVVAAVITPTGDPFTLMVVFLPVYLLWELSAFLVPKTGMPDEEDEENDSPGTPQSVEDLYVPRYRSRS